jgi:hypothetical protein
MMTPTTTAPTDAAIAAAAGHMMRTCATATGKVHNLA